MAESNTTSTTNDNLFALENQPPYFQTGGAAAIASGAASPDNVGQLNIVPDLNIAGMSALAAAAQVAAFQNKYGGPGYNNPSDYPGAPFGTQTKSSEVNDQGVPISTNTVSGPRSVGGGGGGRFDNSLNETQATGFHYEITPQGVRIKVLDYGGSSGGGGGSGGGSFSAAPQAATVASATNFITGQPITSSDQLVPGSGALANLNGQIPPPPGYIWGIDPIKGTVELVDLTPLDKTKPAAGWKWIPADITKPSDPNGQWMFIPSPDVLDKPFEGIPPAIIPWLKIGLQDGVDAVPEGPARAWVAFIVNQAATKQRAPGELPFGMGLPSDPIHGVPEAPMTSAVPAPLTAEQQAAQNAALTSGQTPVLPNEVNPMDLLIPPVPTSYGGKPVIDIKPASANQPPTIENLPDILSSLQSVLGRIPNTAALLQNLSPGLLSNLMRMASSGNFGDTNSEPAPP